VKHVEERNETGVEVRVLKYDGTPHRRWNARLAHRQGTLLVLDAAFEEEVRQSQLGVIGRGPYCNVNMPPEFDGRTLSYVDLDMDIIVSPSFSYEMLDMDEFLANAERYRYPAEVQARARTALDELVSLIEARAFPFNQPF
jgi:protein associated with RNAse G/E